MLLSTPYTIQCVNETLHQNFVTLKVYEETNPDTSFHWESNFPFSLSLTKQNPGSLHFPHNQNKKPALACHLSQQLWKDSQSKYVNLSNDQSFVGKTEGSFGHS